jgi:chromosome segregation ATPase
MPTMKHVWAIALLGLLVACGDKTEPAKTTPAKSGDTTPPAAADNAAAKKQAAEAAAEKRRQERAALEQRREELQSRIAELERKLDALSATHAKEREDLGDIRKLRQRFITERRAMFEATTRYESMQKQFEEIKGVAEKAITADLHDLNEKMAEAEKRYRDALSGWQDSLEEKRFSHAEASPVKLKLDALRLAKRHWFEATPLARSGKAGANEKKIINDAFRAWLGEDDTRTSVIKEVLAQPGAPSGKTPDTYDFTALDFYVLLELYEDVLDRQNIAVERKQLGENAEKVQAIEAEMDVLRNQIAEKMAAGGGDLEIYEDLRSRLPGQRQKAERLQREVEELQRSINEIEAVTTRQDKEADETARALDDAEQELRELNKKLR